MIPLCTHVAHNLCAYIGSPITCVPIVCKGGQVKVTLPAKFPSQAIVCLRCPSQGAIIWHVSYRKVPSCGMFPL